MTFLIMGTLIVGILYGVVYMTAFIVKVLTSKYLYREQKILIAVVNILIFLVFFLGSYKLLGDMSYSLGTYCVIAWFSNFGLCIAIKRDIPVEKKYDNTHDKKKGTIEWWDK